jgi:putative DNA primase/helicase
MLGNVGSEGGVRMPATGWRRRVVSHIFPVRRFKWQLIVEPSSPEADGGNLNLSLCIAAVACRTDREPHSEKLTWGELVQQLSRPHRIGELALDEYLAATREARAAEKDGGGWMPSQIREGGRRNKEDVEKVTALVLDLDKGISRAEIEHNLLGYEYLFHSSHSHTAEKPRWRVVLPLATPIEPERQPALFDHFNGLFGGQLDEACGHDCARFFYLPSCPKDAASLYVHVYHAGRLLDADEVLSEHECAPEMAPAKEAPVKEAPVPKVINSCDR